MRFKRINANLRARYQDALERLERIATYPLGSDSFQISHGPDYFAFFDRLGELHYYAAIDCARGEAERVAAVGAGVIRRVPLRQRGLSLKTWYLCDLKVHPGYRGQRLPLRILSSAFWLNYLRCPRGYAISMNPGDGSPNRIVKLLGHFRWAPVELASTIEIYSLDRARMEACAETLRRHRGPVSYLSLQGRKDIVLASTGAPMKLLHAQFGPCAEAGFPTPQDDYNHMFCAPAGDELSKELRGIGHFPSATASVIAHRMGGCDWRFVLTSDI